MIGYARRDPPCRGEGYSALRRLAKDKWFNGLSTCQKTDGAAFTLNLKEFIQNQILLPRLKKSGGLVVYDPDTPYRYLLLVPTQSMENEGVWYVRTRMLSNGSDLHPALISLSSEGLFVIEIQVPECLLQQQKKSV